jgi:hypothetical protein
MPCEYCSKETRLVRSHAIPEAFFRILRDEERPPILVSNTAGARPARAPIGVYDRETLCDPCERRFSEVDAYGAEALINRLDEFFAPRTLGGQTLCFIGEGIDQGKLKMFFLAVLWRAAISRQRFYERVRLGPHQAMLRSVIEAGACPEPDRFSVLMSRWVPPKASDPLPDALMSPFLERWDGVNAVRLYFGKVIAYIKVDQRPFPPSLRSATLGQLPYAVQVAREFQSSKDFEAMMHVATAALSGKKAK